MMRFWRLVNQAFAAEAFSGAGPRLIGGRWNSKGTAMIYASEHLSLAAMEVFIGLSEIDKGERFYAYPLDIPASIEIARLPFSSLPPDWRSRKHPRSTKIIGDNWIQSGSSVILCVPSVAVPAEFNVLINPAHRDFTKIVIGAPEEYAFDPRLWKK